MKMDDICQKDDYRAAIQDIALFIKTQHLSKVGDVIKKGDSILVNYKKNCIDVLTPITKRILIRSLLDHHRNHIYGQLIKQTCLYVIEEDLEGELEYLLNEEVDL